ncbi:class II aldolase/adducin family protein [Terriglobus sp. TAA 43]|uniref:class II aldolase/adducin family protein n=1 Tax=Terriglobus sp. TAA 43 TaxID=278961 RepID=UPI001E56298A|nr:class II aldolase/adducin family protein [Terriglobus sp. TAA 43]
MNERECTVELGLRRDLKRFSKWLSRLGFTPGTSGNLSVRLDSERLLVTPTGVSKGLIKASDMVIVDLDGRLIAGARKVTSEISMHLAVYRHRADIHAVVHSHPPIATAFACSGRALNEPLCQEAVMTVGRVPLAPYATTGTDEVAASMRPFLTDHETILLANHGVVSYGKTLLDAFMKMETVEHLAQVGLVAHQLGTAQPLGVDQIDRLQSARSKYVHNAQEMYLSPRQEGRDADRLEKATAGTPISAPM